MPVFGPRLDAPSAIGDEGRPRAASLTIAGVVVTGVVVAASFAVGRLGMASLGGTLVALTVAAAAMLNRTRFTPLVLGQVCFVPFAAGLLALVVYSFVGSEFGVLTTGLVAAAVGVAGSWTDVMDETRLKRVFSMTGLWYLSFLLAFVVLFFVGGVVALLVVAVGTFAGGVGPTASVVGFLALVAAAMAAVRVALWALPVVQLGPVSRRPVLERRVARWRRTATVGALAAFSLGVGLSVLGLVGIPARVYAAAPALAGLFRLLSTPFVAGPPVLVVVLCVAASTVAWVARKLTSRFDDSSTRTVASLVSGGLSIVVVGSLGFGLLPANGALGVLAATVTALVVPVAVLMILGAWLVAIDLGVVPDRAGGPAVAAAGLCLATLGAGLAGLPAPLVFACAAATFVVWDVSSFGLGVTAELGHLPETRRLEVFHGVVGVGLGTVAVVALTVLDVLRTTVGSAVVVTPAALLAVLGVVALLALLGG